MDLRLWSFGDDETGKITAALQRWPQARYIIKLHKLKLMSEHLVCPSFKVCVVMLARNQGFTGVRGGVRVPGEGEPCGGC